MQCCIVSKKKEMVGSDVSAILDQESFGVSDKNDPRFVSNDIFMSEINLILQKVFLQFANKEKINVRHGVFKQKKLVIIK